MKSSIEMKNYFGRKKAKIYHDDHHDGNISLPPFSLPFSLPPSLPLSLFPYILVRTDRNSGNLQKWEKMTKEIMQDQRNKTFHLR
jgi:hypothetical protein